MADDELYEKGIAIREEMLGLEHGRPKAAVDGFRNASAVLAEMGPE
jgi:hypothetical protein